MTPLTSSPSAIYSSLAIYGFSVFFALKALLGGWQQAQRERKVVSFLSRHIDDHVEVKWSYAAGADDALASGVFGSKGDAERQRTSTGRIVSLLHADARFFRFEPVHLAMRSEAQPLASHSARIASYQALAVRAGILGTFVGLIMSLSQVQEVFLLRGTELSNDANTTSIAAELNAVRDRIAGLMGEVVQGLSIAFGTSIAGLVAAFVIFFLAGQARDSEQRLVNEIQGICQKVQKLFRDHTNQNTELVRTAEALRGVLRENLSQLSAASKNIDVNTSRIVETSERLGKGLVEPVQLFANNAAALEELLKQSASAAAAAREVSASLLTAEQGAAKRVEAISVELSAFSQRSHSQLSAAIEANGKAATEAANAVAVAVAEAMRALSGELVVGLGQRFGGDLQQQTLSGLLAELGKLHAVHEASIGQIRRESRITIMIAAVLLVAMVAGAFVLQGRIMPKLMSEARTILGLVAPAAPTKSDNHAQ